MSDAPHAPRVNPWSLAEKKDEGAMWLAWIVRLRWVAIVTQLLTLSLTFAVLDQPAVVIPVLLVAIFALAGANAATLARLRTGAPVPPETLLAQLLLDVGELTLFFLAAGGSENPFTVLYAVHVAMAAVMLDGTYAAIVVAVVVAANLLLHVVSLPLHLDRHVIATEALRSFGQITALTVTVVSVNAFVVGLAATLRRNKHRLLVARERSHRNDRLRAVGTLAAGAAHELNTPLSTIGLRLRRVARRHTDADTVKDLDVIQTQLARCTHIVENLLVGAGDPTAKGIQTADLREIVANTARLWTKSASLPLREHVKGDPIWCELPPVAFMQALTNLLENARQAQEDAGDPTTPLELFVQEEAGGGLVRVVDHGPGLPPDEADRVGEPFFTTKPTGTGLGVFVARAVAEGAGGSLRYDRVGDTTHTLWWFPNSERSA